MRRSRQAKSSEESASSQPPQARQPTGVRARRRAMDIVIAIVATRLAEVRFEHFVDEVLRRSPDVAEQGLSWFIDLANGVPWGTLLVGGSLAWGYLNFDRLRSAGSKKVRARTRESIRYEAAILVAVAVAYGLGLDFEQGAWVISATLAIATAVCILVVGSMRFGDSKNGGPLKAIQAWLQAISLHSWRSDSMGWTLSLLLVLIVLLTAILVPGRASIWVHSSLSPDSGQEQAPSPSEPGRVEPETKGPTVIRVSPPPGIHTGEAAPAEAVQGDSTYTG